jgi:hypothetical protein
VKMTAYDAAASIDHLTLSTGDGWALLKGTRLDQVASAKLEGIGFSPVALTHVDDFDQLMMNAGSSTAGLKPGTLYRARVELKDGRELKTTVTVDPPRPQIALLSKGIQDDATARPQPVQFGSSDDLPVDSRLVFFLKSTSPASFPRSEKVEVAATDSSFHTLLELTDGSLMLEDAKTAVGRLEPLSKFGASAFGPVHIRAVAADGTTGDWLPLGTLVRLPEFKDLRCPRAAAKPCVLSGNNLFLAASIASTPDFGSSIDVPAEFTGTQLTVPHPSSGVLFVKLRDDPATVQTLTLPVTPIAAPADSAGKTQPPAAEPRPDAPSGVEGAPSNPPQSPESAGGVPNLAASPAQGSGLSDAGKNANGASAPQ